MSIRFTCPHCDTVIKVPDSGAGQIGKCPTCRNTITVPIVNPQSLQTEPEPEPEPPQPQPTVPTFNASIAGHQESATLFGPVSAKVFSESTPLVISTALTVLALIVGRILIGLLPGVDTAMGDLSLYEWLSIGVMVTVIVFMVRVYVPLHNMVLYYFTNKLKVNADNQNYEQVQKLCNYFQMLVYIIVLFPSAFPPLRILILKMAHDSQGHKSAEALITIIAITVIGAAIFFCYSIWSTMRPQLDTLSQKISSSITASATSTTSAPVAPVVPTSQTEGVVYCSKCGTAHQKDSRFCGSCGNAIS